MEKERRALAGKRNDFMGREKRFICFTCYSFHPEMRGVSEKEFRAGNKACREEKCKFKGRVLEESFHCEECGKMLPWKNARLHGHEKKF